MLVIIFGIDLDAFRLAVATEIVQLFLFFVTEINAVEDESLVLTRVDSEEHLVERRIKVAHLVVEVVELSCFHRFSFMVNFILIK